MSFGSILIVALYIACEMIANTTANKPVQLPGGIVVPAAVFIYALTFTLIDLVNERFGKQGARYVVYSAFIANILLAAYMQFAVWLPPAPWYAGEGQAAFEAVRQEGLGVLTARRIAKELDCSTHPIYRAFQSMQELEEAVIEHAREYAVSYLLQERDPEWPFLSIGLQYLRFAREERELFKLLFMSGRFKFDFDDEENPFRFFLDRMKQDPNLQRLDDSRMKRIYMNMWIFTHGLATLFSVNSVEQSEETIRELLSQMGKTIIEWEHYQLQQNGEEAELLNC